MKKTLAIILVAVMLLSTLVSLVVPAAAEEAGNWEVYLTATSVDNPPEKNPPLPGYYYDEAGFHTISPDYTNFNPKFSVTSKEMYNIKDFTMTIVVHDYCAKNDNWLSFSIWSESNGMSQGDTSGKYGDGWTSLIRGDAAAGTLNRFESWDMRKGGRSGKQVFSAIDNTQIAPVVFEQNVDAETGDFIITFSIENGVVKVNGTPIGAGTDQVISDRFKEGLAYVSVTINNTDPSGEYFPTISVLDVNGSVPSGSDRREAEGKVREYGPMRDSDSVPANTPAVWFDGTLEATNDKLPRGSSCDITFADDNASMKVTAGANLFYMQFEVPDEISYKAEDFTYIAYIFKNFCTCNVENPNDDCTAGEVCNTWYCAGKLTAPGGTCVGPIPMFYHVTPVDENGAYTSDDYYTVAVYPIVHEEWTGRINSFRLDISGYANFGVEGKNSFDIMGAGIFRSGEDVCGFVSEFRDLGLNTEWLEMDLNTSCDHFDFDEDGLCDICNEEMPTEPPVSGEVTTEEAGNEVTTEPTAGEVTTEEGEVSGSEEETTKKPAATTAAASSDEGEEEVKKGCGSVVSMGALAIVAIVGTGLVIKKKED